MFLTLFVSDSFTFDVSRLSYASYSDGLPALPPLSTSALLTMSASAAQPSVTASALPLSALPSPLPVAPSAVTSPSPLPLPLPQPLHMPLQSTAAAPAPLPLVANLPVVRKAHSKVQRTKIGERALTANQEKIKGKKCCSACGATDHIKSNAKCPNKGKVPVTQPLAS